jgi:hypothetical protein
MNKKIIACEGITVMMKQMHQSDNSRNDSFSFYEMYFRCWKAKQKRRACENEQSNGGEKKPQIDHAFVYKTKIILHTDIQPLKIPPLEI